MKCSKLAMNRLGIHYKEQKYYPMAIDNGDSVAFYNLRRHQIKNYLLK
jgi:hypothetical protein